MVKVKKYPFSIIKHAHDIEYRRNRVKNELCDYFNKELDLNEKEFDKLCKLEEKLTELLQVILNNNDGRICYLTGEQIGLAKESVLWANNMRICQ